MELKFVRGVTREVIIIGGLVFKIPSFRSYKLFLHGLLANMQEKEWWYHTRDKRLCPIWFYIPLGLLVIMPRLTAAKSVNFLKFSGLPLDKKIENFGKYKGKVVLLDYGN